MKPDADVLDYRSDTFTKPTAPMREAMARAEVGDDVFLEDPTVNRLEERSAELFGRQAALFVPSGTMANLISLALHCQRGDEVIMERRTHSFAHEVGGGAALLGILFSVQDSPDGILGPELAEAAIRQTDVHQPVSKLLILENTVNLAGGRIVSLERIREMRELTRRHGMRLHLDGARIFNASLASGVEVAKYAAEVDTLSFCLSKGLGCPVGSIILGDEEDMQQARWYRKMLGGGMRQAGFLAACGLYALEHHVERLAEDHRLARETATVLQELLDDRFRVEKPETNILLVHTDSRATTESTLSTWEKLGILALPLADKIIRLVTHLDLPRQATEEMAGRLRESKP